MVTYKSANGRTISVGRLQITTETGVTLGAPDEALEQLVVEGFLTKEDEDLVVAEIAKEEVAVVAPNVEPPVVTTKPK